jgi:hypothetical protein
MALFNKSYVISRADTLLNKSFGGVYTQDSVAIESAMRHFSESSERVLAFDIFLSHSYSDRKGAIGIKNILENDFGYSVYIDWVVDRDLNRDNVSTSTAKRIKERMKKCKCLFYVTSTNASTSKWMPWETGLMDGLKNRVAICPFSDNSRTNQFVGQEYLGIYPYITIDKTTTSTNEYLWIQIDANTYVKFDDWLKGTEPYKHQ